jgi:hypothetical protein
MVAAITISIASRMKRLCTSISPGISIHAL